MSRTRHPGRAQIACIVTPHGFGHAARAAAVVAALQRRCPGLRCHLFTTVPRWFFADSLRGPWVLHPFAADVGLVQRSPLEEDLPATAARLEAFWREAPAAAEGLAARLRRLGCRLALCDISPLGIAAAATAGIPSVLVENFTWDWIYRGYAGREPRLRVLARALAPRFARADLRIQAEPVCAPSDGAVRVPPVARRARTSRRRTREALGVRPRRPMVLVTMGGVAHAGFALEGLRACAGVDFVLAGGARRRRAEGHLVFLPHRSGFFHPDLVAAADAVVGKAGYSTVAEVARAGIPYGYVPRPAFRESDVLAAWLRERRAGLEIGAASFEGGGWAGRVEELLDLPRREPCADGAAAVAEVILGQGLL